MFPHPFKTQKNGQSYFIFLGIRRHKKDTGNTIINNFIYEFHNNKSTPK